jgi:hypothetical protein
MGDSVFTVTDPRAPRQAVSPDIRSIAERLAAQASANTPRLTGRLAAGYHVQPGQEPGTSVVVNDVPYARFVEYGTRDMAAEAPLGRALAAARGGG